MQNILITPKEEKNKNLNNLKPNKIPFNILKIKKRPINLKNNLQTTPSTPNYGRKFVPNFKFNYTKTNNKINKINPDYDLEQRNKYYFKKLFEIKHNNSSRKLSSKIIFNPYPHRKDGHIKLDIMNLAQQNLYMLKRLYEKKSEYSAKKMEKDYQRVQGYKRIMCKFPDINFSKTKELSSNNYAVLENKFLKSENSDRSTFLPTINYINEGSMIKIKKRLLKDMKKREPSFILPRNLKIDFLKANQNNTTNNNTTNNKNKKENAKEEFEFEFDKGNNDNNDNNNKNIDNEKMNK
jgi:hypothetical protein